MTPMGSMSKERRRDRRIPQLGQVRMSWQDARGQQKYVQARLFEVSAAGLRMMEVPEPIPLMTNVNLACEKLNLAGSAWVRHCSRHGAKFIIGLELSSRFRSELLRQQD